MVTPPNHTLELLIDSLGITSKIPRLNRESRFENPVFDEWNIHEPKAEWEAGKIPSLENPSGSQPVLQCGLTWGNTGSPLTKERMLSYEAR